MRLRRPVISQLFRRATPIVVLFVMVSLLAARVAAQASGTWFRFEAEQGTLTGQTQAIGDATASGGNALQFTAVAQPGGPLPNPGTWSNATGNLAGMSSECGNLTLLSQVPGADKTIAGVARVGLFATGNGGSSWSALGTGSGSAPINNRPSSIVYDPTSSSTFWVSGIYGDGVFKTTNGGSTFQRLGNVSHVDSVSVDFTDPNRQTLLAGGHEASRTVWKSTDGGQNWTNIGGGISGTGFSTSAYIINSQTYLVNSMVSWGGGTAGIYRTTNGGSSWQQVSTINVAKLLVKAPDGTMYWNLQGGGIARSTDSGQSWTALGQGAGLRGEREPIVLPDGRIAALGGGGIMVSADKGATWAQSGANFPSSEVDGVEYSPTRNAFFTWHWDCGNNVLSNAIQRLQ